MHDKVMSHVNEWLPIITPYALRAVYAILILIVGFWLGRRLSAMVVKIMNKDHHIDPTVKSFTKNLINVLVSIAVIIAALSKLGVQTSSFIAIIAAAGLGIGMALRSSLSNLASGFLMVFFRPFHVGDKINIDSQVGIVQEITILYTVIKTFDDTTLTVPNDQFMKNIFTNYSSTNTMRRSIVVGISYSDDIALALNTLLEVAAAHPKVLQTPTPPVSEVVALGQSSVDLRLKYSTSNADYAVVFSDLTRLIKEKFDEVGLSIPFPQCDLHIIDNKLPATSPTK